MKRTIFFEGEFTDQNTYFNAERSHWSRASTIKKGETERVAWICKSKRVKPIPGLCNVKFTWFCKDSRKDSDNVSFATKFLLDGIVKAGVLKDDSRKFVNELHHYFEVDPKRVGVEVVLTNNIT